MGFPSPPKPPAIPMPPPAAHPPTLGSASVALTGTDAKRRQAAAAGAGFDDTIATSPQGVSTKASTAKATLLGQ